VQDHFVRIQGYPRRVRVDDEVANQVRLIFTGQAVTPSHVVINRPVFQLVVPIRSIVALETRAKGSRDTVVDVLRCY
jgi:hypothetical protein